MTCPSCGGRPLSFREYWNGINAVRVECGECGEPLKANMVTWAWLLACAAGLALFFVVLFANVGRFVLSEEVAEPAIFLWVLLCAALSWFTGGYVAAAPAEGNDEEDTGKPASGGQGSHPADV